MTVQAAIDRLLVNHPKGFDLSLDRVSSLLERLGNPQDRIPPVFHVAGTNGKGSTAAFLRAILEAAGHSVHVHTSPHLVQWNERYRLGGENGEPGKLVSDEVLEDAILRAEAANASRSITVFEIMSAVGFLLFAEHPADCCVVEVGLGGRFDATNVLPNPVACLITPIALDHQAYLGDTISAIAFEKAGIIKGGAPVIVGRQDEDALSEIERVAELKGSETTVAGRDFDYFEQGGRFIFQDENGLLDLPLPRLVGVHQLSNAAVAIVAIRRVLPELSLDAFDRGMQAVQWPGRFEHLRPGALLQSVDEELRAHFDFWVDGGHNPQAGTALAAALASLEERAPMPLVLVCGMLTTKDPSGFFKAFAGLAREILTVPVTQSDSSFSPEELAATASKTGVPARPMGSIEEAIAAIAQDHAHDQSVRVMICGSLYLVGQVLELNGTPPA